MEVRKCTLLRQTCCHSEACGDLKPLLATELLSIIFTRGAERERPKTLQKNG